MNISTPEFRIKLGKRIKQLRLEVGLTQQELATKIGFKDKQIINRYEVEGANPTAYSLMHLARALNVGIEEFFDFSSLEKDSK